MVKWLLLFFVGYGCFIHYHKRGPGQALALFVYAGICSSLPVFKLCW
jgi:hypothetical protein